MKNLQDIIQEKLQIGSKTKVNSYKYQYHPKDKGELRKLLEELIIERGKNADLNDIDTSKIIDMSYLFDGFEDELNPHNIDLSNWDVSNVENMKGMFYTCEKFNSDLSKWNVSNVENMRYMFHSCYNFNSDLSKWNVSNVTDMISMFNECENFNSDLSKWNVSNVKDMYAMFYNCKKFNSDLNNWNVSKVTNMEGMFKKCPLQKNPPKWYKS